MPMACSLRFRLIFGSQPPRNVILTKTATMDTQAPLPASSSFARARSSASGNGRGRGRLPGWIRRPRWPRIRSSIGTRLAVLALALGLPFVVYVGGNAARQAGLEREEVKARTLSLARLFAARVDDYVGDMQ